MIKRQLRLSPEIRTKLKIDAVKNGITQNALLISILRNRKNWQIPYRHERIPIPLSKSLVMEYTEELRRDILRLSKKVNEKNQGLKITDEMIIHQIVTKYYDTVNTNNK